MLAMLEDAPLRDESLVYEPKYDGIRALVELDRGAHSPIVRIWSRLGNEKTAQFPDLVDALSRFTARLKGPVLLDGEIVALDEQAEPAGFQKLQGRIHLSEGAQGPRLRRVAFIMFDALRDGDEDLMVLPLVTRRARLERIFRRADSPILRLSDVSVGDGRAMYHRALERGWEGVIAKRVTRCTAWKAHADWRKLKIVRQQEFVVGGWTESRTARRPFGALLLGYYDKGNLIACRPHRQRIRRAR